VDKIKIRFDPTNNTLIVWFTDPAQMAYLTPIEEETPGDFHLIKNDDGEVIGIECQFYHIGAGEMAVEFVSAPLLKKEPESV